MKRRTYDDYDYEEEYNKQLNNLEEWEYEKLLEEKKVESLYRTATTKSENPKSKKTLLEAQIYPSFYRKQDVPRGKRKKKTKAAIRNMNDKNSRRYLARLLNINFGEGDLWCTFGWDKEHYPEDEERARKDIKNWLAKINRKRKKTGQQNIKYVYILAYCDYERPHFHIVLEGAGVDRDEIEDMWNKCSRKNTRRIKPDQDYLITGIAAYISKNPHGSKRWCSSRNLTRPPKATKSYSRFRKRKVLQMAKDHETLKQELEKEYKGYRVLDAEVRWNGVTAAFYIYARMIRD